MECVLFCWCSLPILAGRSSVFPAYGMLTAFAAENKVRVFGGLSYNPVIRKHVMLVVTILCNFLTKALLFPLIFPVNVTLRTVC